MVPSIRWLVRLSSLCGVAGLLGCALVDQFSDRAVEYNRQAEQAQEQALLLNVLRAKDQRPMQFTTLQSVTGQASASGGSTLTLPFGHHPNTSVRNLMLTDTVSGGPNFTVSVLDTQEFYQGLMNPISGQLLDLYIQARYPAEQILDLMIQKVVIQPTKPTTKAATSKSTKSATADTVACEEPKADQGQPSITFANHPADDFEFDLFQALMEHWLHVHKLTTEKIEKTTALGPPLSAAEATKQLKALVAAGVGGLKVQEIKQNNSGCSGYKDTDKGKFQIVKSEASYRFCFALPITADVKTKPEERGYCGGLQTTSQLSSLQTAFISANLSEARTLWRRLAMIVDADCDAIAKETQLKNVRCRMADANGQRVKCLAIERKLTGEDMLQGRSPPPALSKVQFDGILHAYRIASLDDDNRYQTALDAKTDVTGDACYDYVINSIRPFAETGTNPTFAISFYPRSTESIIYFLGEMIRRQTKTPTRVEQIKLLSGGEHYGTFECSHQIQGVTNKNIDAKSTDASGKPLDKSGTPASAKDAAVTTASEIGHARCTDFFYVESIRNSDNAYLSVEYDGTLYGIPRDSGRAGYSFPTLELVKQLLAINTSAKELPATTVLSITSSP